MDSKDLNDMTDEELDTHRRDVLTEQERRRKLEQGKERIGDAVADYLEAAGITKPADDPAELGELVIGMLTERDQS